MASISNFISKVKNENLARENRFEIVITPPLALNMSTDEFESLLFYCQSASLPAVSFLTQPVYSYGESREVIYNRNYEPVQLEFLVDTDMKVKWFFDRWMDTIVDPRTRLLSYYRDYIATVDISQLDHSENEEVKYTVRLHESFPKSIDAIQYTSAGKDYIKVRVTMQYKYWNVVTAPKVNRQTAQDVPNLGIIETPI